EFFILFTLRQQHGSYSPKLERSAFAAFGVPANWFVTARPAPTTLGSWRGGSGVSGAFGFCSGSESPTGSATPNALNRIGGAGGLGGGGASSNTSCTFRNRSVNVCWMSRMRSSNIENASCLYSINGSFCPHERYWIAERSWSRS